MLQNALAGPGAGARSKPCRPWCPIALTCTSRGNAGKPRTCKKCTGRGCFLAHSTEPTGAATQPSVYFLHLTPYPTHRSYTPRDPSVLAPTAVHPYRCVRTGCARSAKGVRTVALRTLREPPTRRPDRAHPIRKWCANRAQGCAEAAVRRGCARAGGGCARFASISRTQ